VVDNAALVESAQVALADGDVHGAITHLREAVAVRPDPSARELLGGLLFFVDDLAGARQELERAFREWRNAGEPRAAALVAALLADLHSSGFGNRVVGRGWVARARRLLAPEGRCVEQGYVGLAVMACETDDVERLEQATRFALELAGEFGDSELEVRALADSGYALVVRGRVAEGFARLDEAMAALSAGEVRSPSTAGKTYCALLSACERTGDVARAEEWTRVIYDDLSQLTGGRSRIMYAQCRLVYGSALCTAGRWPEGEAALLDVLGPNGTAYRAHYAEAAVRLASLRLMQGRVEEAAELLGPFEDRPDACEPLGRVHLLGGELDLAEVLLAAGARGAAIDHARAAAAIFDRLGAAQLFDRTEAVLRSLGVRARSAGHRPAVAVAGLTEREQQVLELLRGGLTNPEIGERLFISVKTVEHHVGRVLAKLGVRNRAEAAAVAAAAALVPNPPSLVS
jgi:DNA-binding CsgD family transcriptional regulator